LFFKRADPISIHTLTCAGYDVLIDLCKNQEIEPFVRSSQFIRQGKEREYFNILNRAQNFFKHADRDSNILLNFNPESTEFLLWDATRLYRLLTNENTPIMGIFYIWFVMKNNDFVLIDNERFQQLVNNLKKSTYNPDNKLAFYALLTDQEILDKVFN